MADIKNTPNRRKEDLQYVSRYEFETALSFFEQINKTVLDIHGLVQTILTSQSNIEKQFKKHEEDEQKCKYNVDQLMSNSVREDSSRKTLVWVGKVVSGTIILAGVLITAIYHFITLAK